MIGMKEENWIRNTNPVREWLNETEENEKTLVIAQTMAIGDQATTDDMRSVYWTAIRNMGKGCDTFPQSTIGKPSTLPTDVQSNVDSVKKTLHTAFAQFGEDNPDIALMVIATLFPHGRTGGAFSTFEDWVTATVSGKAANNMVSAYRATPKRWGGKSAKNGLPLKMVPLPVKPKKAKATATEEVSEEE